MCINGSRGRHLASSVGHERQAIFRGPVIRAFNQRVTEHLIGRALRFAAEGEERHRVHKSSFFLRAAAHAFAVSAHFVHECRDAFYRRVLGNSMPEVEDMPGSAAEVPGKWLVTC